MLENEGPRPCGRVVTLPSMEKSKQFFMLVLLASFSHSVDAKTPSVWDGKVCPTGDIQRVVIDISTGEWKFLEESTNDDGKVNAEESILNDLNVRRELQFQIDSALIASMAVDTDRFRRFLSTDGSNSLAISESGNENVKDTTTVMTLARPCGCVDDDDSRFALCPESSDWCSIDENELSATCYSVGWIDSIIRNLWPLLWLWYCAIFVAVCCTFQGRIILDYVRGTILYYFCGFGDPSRNGEERNVNRYNLSIVEEILYEERQDRRDVRRRRNNGSVANRQIDAIVNQTDNGVDTEQERDVPPTIVTSPSFLASGSINDTYSDGDVDSSYSPISWLISYFRNVVWPWQTSWKRYIKYNLLLRVEWMAIQDEVAFIESRQERGLPHARYEMKTRRWNAATDGCSCSVEPSSLANSVDEPHCTICFTELEDGDRVGDLGCPHVFHADCLKMWVTKRNSCPLCNIPIARRKRISSDEFVKDDILNNGNRDDLESAASLRNPTPADSGYDNTLPPTEGSYGSPSYQHRRGPRRLSQMPITPSTVAASNYSEEDLDDLEAVDFSRERNLPSQDTHEVVQSPSRSVENNAEILVSQSNQVSIERPQISENQEVDDEPDHSSVESSLATPPRDGASLNAVGCDINGHLLARDNNDTSSDASIIDIPSPPRMARRRVDENESETVVRGSNSAPPALVFSAVSHLDDQTPLSPSAQRLLRNEGDETEIESPSSDDQLATH